MKTRSDDILEQLSYLKELADQSRIKIAVGYPFFFLWGLVWLVGYLSSLWIFPGKLMGGMWLAIVIIGIGITIILVNRIGQQKEPVPALLKKLGWLSLSLWIADLLLFALVFRGVLNINLISAYWPFQIGVIYLANSIFFDNQLAKVGLWLIITALISLLIPIPYLFIWLALAGGGGLVFTGYIFRKQVAQVG